MENRKIKRMLLCCKVDKVLYAIIPYMVRVTEFVFSLWFFIDDFFPVLPFSLDKPICGLQLKKLRPINVFDHGSFFSSMKYYSPLLHQMFAFIIDEITLFANLIHMCISCICHFIFCFFQSQNRITNQQQQKYLLPNRCQNHMFFSTMKWQNHICNLEGCR